MLSSDHSVRAGWAWYSRLTIRNSKRTVALELSGFPTAGGYALARTGWSGSARDGVARSSERGHVPRGRRRRS